MKLKITEQHIGQNRFENSVELALQDAYPNATKWYADWQICFVEIGGKTLKAQTPDDVRNHLKDFYNGRAKPIEVEINFLQQPDTLENAFDM